MLAVAVDTWTHLQAAADLLPHLYRSFLVLLSLSLLLQPFGLQLLELDLHGVPILFPLPQRRLQSADLDVEPDVLEALLDQLLLMLLLCLQDGVHFGPSGLEPEAAAELWHHCLLLLGQERSPFTVHLRTIGDRLGHTRGSTFSPHVLDLLN